MSPLKFLIKKSQRCGLKAKQTYSVEFKEQVLSKVLQRGSRTVGSVANELNVNVLTLRKWMRDAAAANRSSGSGHARRPEDWSLEEKLMALQEPWAGRRSVERLVS
ncbi:transposase [Paraburkholderia domus]|uniref:transposase n=1 Tax=Paraburkholderia domus TaxID=2793075 RepID=UPI002E2C455B|nr:transposase [Paraburkholderia domus]